MRRIGGTLELHLPLGGGGELGPLRPRGSIWEQSGSTWRLQPSPTFDLLPPRNRKRQRVKLARRRKGPFNTRGGSVVISAPLLPGCSTRSACFCCPTSSAYAHTVPCLHSALLSLRHKDKEEGGTRDLTVPPGEFNQGSPL